MLVLTPKYGSQIDLDLLKKQKKETLKIKHRNDIIYLTYCEGIEEAYLAFLKNKGKYFIGYKPEDHYEINGFISYLGEIDTLDVSWIDVSELDELSSCFKYCKAKHIIGLDKWDVSNVKIMTGMFYGCKTLESIDDISRWDVSKVTHMNQMFYECKKLESIGNLSGWDVSKVQYIFEMFNYCNNLKNIGDISGWDVSNVQAIFGMFSMFSECKNLKTVGNLERWNISNTVNVKYMFNGSAIKPIPSWYKNMFYD